FTTTLFGQTDTVKHLPAELQNSGIYHITAVRTVDTAPFVGVDIHKKTGQTINNSDDQKAKEALEWVHAELPKAEHPEVLTSCDGDDFFRRDSVRIVGYIKGYEPRLGFSGGIIYQSGLFTREDFPATARIYENGT